MARNVRTSSVYLSRSGTPMLTERRPIKLHQETAGPPRWSNVLLRTLTIRTTPISQAMRPCGSVCNGSLWAGVTTFLLFDIANHVANGLNVFSYFVGYR